MKTVISYVSGCGGDFVVNCCNHAWNLKCTESGAMTPSASIRSQETQLGDSGFLDTIQNIPYDYVGSHSIDRLLRLPIRPLWLVVPDKNNFITWVARDIVTRNSISLMGQFGDFYNSVKELVNVGQQQHAAELFLDRQIECNWTAMQMRLVQPNNQIDISQMLTNDGINSVIDQMPELAPVAIKCRIYHRYWLSTQQPFTDIKWVINCLVDKLNELVQDH